MDLLKNGVSLNFLTNFECFCVCVVKVENLFFEKCSTVECLVGAETVGVLREIQ